MENEIKLFTAAETAKLLKVSERQIWRYVKSGKLKVIRVSPKTLRFADIDIQKFLDKK